MLIKITAKRQATFPAKVLAAIGVQPGDYLELRESPAGYVITPRRIDPSRLAPLRAKLRKGQGSFDVQTFREQPHDPALRD